MSKGLLKNTLNKIAPRFGPDLDGTIEENPRHSTALLRFFQWRRVQKWDARCSSYFLTGPKVLAYPEGITKEN